MLKGPINRLRFIGNIEGVSYLVLLFLAMPLKYFADRPMMVTWVGWIHGVLFVLYCFSILEVKLSMSWKIWTAFIPFIAALVPFGPFLIDNWLKKKAH